MILLTLPNERPANPLQAKGWDAEKQMAFYLARAFEAKPDVAIFHSLRFLTPQTSSQTDFTQIDHLILHRHGAVIVESKSTGDGTGEFRVDRLGQWTRRSGPGRPEINIPSPLKQAERQADSLRALLGSAKPPLVTRLGGLRIVGFRDFPIFPLVAIADTARLAGARGEHEKNVLKADEIADAILAEIERHRRGGSVAHLMGSTLASAAADTLADSRERRRLQREAQEKAREERANPSGEYKFSEEEFARICRYVLSQHSPVSAPVAAPVREVPPPTPAPHAPEPRSAPASASKAPADPGRTAPSPVQRSDGERIRKAEAITCRHCRSIRVRVVFRRDYCVLCDECNGYTPLARVCPVCGGPASVHKDGADYFRACESAGNCGAKTVFWQEPASG